MVKLRSVLIFILLAAVVALGVACSSNESPSQTAGAQDESQPAAVEQGDQAAGAVEQQESQSGSEMAQPEEQPAEMPKSVELTGMVEQGDNGVVIVTDLGKYSVVGQDLSSMVGKTVKVTGALEESAGQYTINVESVEESQ